MKKVDILKACISLQHMLDGIEKDQNWLTTEFTGLKGVHKKWFLSRWNSEMMSVGLGVGCVLAFLGVDVLTGMTHSNGLQLFSLTTMMPAALLLYSQNLRRHHMIGSDEQLSSPANKCELHILDAFLHSFEQNNPDIAIGFIKKIEQLKSKGLTPYQAYQIVQILKREFLITEQSVLSETLLPSKILAVGVQDVAEVEMLHCQQRITFKL